MIVNCFLSLHILLSFPLNEKWTEKRKIIDYIKIKRAFPDKIFSIHSLNFCYIFNNLHPFFSFSQLSQIVSKSEFVNIQNVAMNSTPFATNVLQLYSHHVGL